MFISFVWTEKRILGVLAISLPHNKKVAFDFYLILTSAFFLGFSLHYSLSVFKSRILGIIIFSQGGGIANEGRNQKEWYVPLPLGGLQFS